MNGLTPSEHRFVERTEAAAQAMGGVDAIYARLDTASDEELRSWLAARTQVERDVIVFLLALREPPPDPHADLIAFLRLDERVLYGRLKTATPEFRARFAKYLEIREACRTPEAMLAMIDKINGDAP